MVGMPYFAIYFYFLYFKTITKYNYKLFPKNGKLNFLKFQKAFENGTLRFCVIPRHFKNYGNKKAYK